MTQIKKKKLLLIYIICLQIFEGIKNEDPFIRNEAVKCLGLMSLLNKEFAMQHLLLFVQVNNCLLHSDAKKINETWCRPNKFKKYRKPCFASLKTLLDLIVTF